MTLKHEIQRVEGLLNEREELLLTMCKKEEEGAYLSLCEEIEELTKKIHSYEEPIT